MRGRMLLCHDGSAGSRHAIAVVADLVGPPPEALVLTVWLPVYLRLAVSVSFGPLPLSDEPELDRHEADNAELIAEEGARLAGQHGVEAKALAEPAHQSVGHTILEVADRLDIALIVCGQRGRGPVSAAGLGSVTQSVAIHSRRPVLVVPERA